LYAVCKTLLRKLERIGMIANEVASEVRTVKRMGPAR
jgi:hypothetical protein